MRSWRFKVKIKLMNAWHKNKSMHQPLKSYPSHDAYTML
jgi:hypothetical protein